MQEVTNALSISVIVSASNPLELIKSRYQTMNQMIAKGALNRHYSGIKDCAKYVTSQQGVRALWKGNSISILRFFPNENINFSVKNLIRSLLPNNFISNVIAGIGGGLTAATILYPIDTARVFIATSHQKVSTTANQLVKNIKFEGLRFLYRGFSSCLLGIALFRGSYLGLYDTFKIRASNNFQKWMIAYCSGLFSGLLVYPLETLRKRNIVSKQKIKETKLLKNIIVNEGFRNLFRGCSITPLQSFAGSAVILYFDTNQSQL